MSVRREVSMRLDEVVVGDSFKDDGRDQVVAIYSQEGVYLGTKIALLVHHDPTYLDKPKVKVYGSGYATVRVWRVLELEPVPVPASMSLLGAMQEFVDKHGYEAFKEIVLDLHTS